jgi:hypothetical protein
VSPFCCQLCMARMGTLYQNLEIQMKDKEEEKKRTREKEFEIVEMNI